MRTPGLLRSFGHVFGSGLANELLDRLFPAPPSWSERFLKGFSESLLAALPYVVERMAPPDPKPVEAAPPPVVPPFRAPPFWVPPPPCKVLGQFTCPKCGGHTWGWMGEQGRDENGTYLRRCHGPCYFTWKATEDHLYFAPPTDEERKQAQAEQVCVPVGPWCQKHHKPAEICGPCAREQVRAEARVAPSPEDEAVQVAISKEWPRETPPPIDILRMDLASLRSIVGSRAEPDLTLIGAAVKMLREADSTRLPPDLAQRQAEREALNKVIGNRRSVGESLTWDAARLLAEADAYIAKQAEKIRGLVADNEFKVNCGEFSVTLSPEIAHGWGMRPGRLAIVLNDGRWSVRNGSALEPIKWNQAYLLLEEIEQANTGAIGGPVKKEIEQANATAEMSVDVARRDVRKVSIDTPCDWCEAIAGQSCHETGCPNAITRAVVVGGKATLSAQDAAELLKSDAIRKQVGGPVRLNEESEVSAFVDDAERAKCRWQEYLRKVDERKAADNLAIDETAMAQTAAGGVA